MKDIKIEEENWDFLWDIKRDNRLKNMDEVITFLKEKIKRN